MTTTVMAHVAVPIEVEAGATTVIHEATRALYDRDGAAAYLSTSTSTIDRLARSGILTPVIPAGMKATRRWRRADLDAYAAAATPTSTPS